MDVTTSSFASPSATRLPVLPTSLGRRRALLRPAKDLERSLEACLRTDARIEPRHRLDVVVHDLRPLGEYGVERVEDPAEVRDEHLDGRAGRLRADLGDRLREHPRAAVLELVTVHARDDRVLDAHPRDGLTDAG